MSEENTADIALGLIAFMNACEKMLNELNEELLKQEAVLTSPDASEQDKSVASKMYETVSRLKEQQSAEYNKSLKYAKAFIDKHKQE